MRQLAPTTPLLLLLPPSLPVPSVPPPTHLPSLRLRFRAHPCPWAHRALILLALAGVESSVRLEVVTPGLDGAWMSGDGSRLRDVYKRRKGGYEGRATVPMLWDEEREEVVCNESWEIVKFLSSIGGLDLWGEETREEIERWNGIVYPNVNNGVYRCGFAQSQEAYDSAVNDLFSTLDMLEAHLSTSRYLCGDSLTLADICLFTTLIRFDLVYHGLFKCSKKKLIEYPNLYAYTRDVYQIPKVAETCNFEAIMDGYYRILFPLNPGSIRPIMPSACQHEHLLQPHNRELLPSRSSREAQQLHAI
ncbi:uncharacterized protein A4U43_C07F20210 [Asparagus officinalis]|uniref:GST C-terminal domain-containing protein n=1 Tax=Asparagus officinalis TaxID=4686 RepID=A0A5P1EDS4_ASPOF|nr:uncharacterized protein A4U43_C07F20210 [Asparagus officinalis]